VDAQAQINKEGATPVRWR